MLSIHADLLQDGIQGDLFYTESSSDNEKAMIVLGSSSMRFKKTKKIAAEFSRRGIPSLALAYSRKAGLSTDISKIPVEYIKYAVNWLHRKGYTRVGLYGFSKGAEFALTAASLLPEIKFVVAVSPFDCVLEGENFFCMPTNCSSWSFNGKELPWIPWRARIGSVLSTSLLTGQLDMRFRYRDALRFASNRTFIKVEKISGPILFVTADDDGKWPSKEAVMRMKSRLRSARFPHTYGHLNYHFGTHNMLPFERVSPLEKVLFSDARDYEDEYTAARLHSAKRIAEFVHSV